MFRTRAIRRGLLALCVGLLGPSGPVPGQETDLGEVEALLSARRFQDARKVAREGLARAASTREALPWRWILAESFRLEGDYEEAEASYRDFAGDIEGAPRVEATLQVARCRLRMWDGKGAVQALSNLPARDLGPLGDEHDELEAIALFVAGKPNHSLKALEALPRKSSAGWHYLGLISFDSGEFEKALEYFGHALAASPGDYYNLLYRASSLIQLDRVKEARAALEEVLKVGDTPEASLLLGRLELRAERFERAESLLRKALRKSPGNAEAQFSLMTTLRRQKKTEEARQAGRKFKELHARQQEGLTYAYRLSQEHERSPEDPVPAEKLAIHYYASDDPAAAERMAWRALRVAPDRVRVRLCLARTCALVGRFQEAAVHYRKILRQHPGHPDAQKELRELVRRHARAGGGSKGND